MASLNFQRRAVAVALALTLSLGVTTAFAAGTSAAGNGVQLAPAIRAPGT